MVNFPVGTGTSGHLLGGALAAALVGPWTGVLVMATVLLVQGLLFADGGLTALGTNITLMGLVTVLVGYLVTRTLLTVLPKRPRSVVPAAVRYPPTHLRGNSSSATRASQSGGGSGSGSEASG